MSGIFGCWHLDRAPVDRQAFATCLDRLSPRQASPAFHWHHGAVAFGYKSNADRVRADSRQPNARTTEVACVFDGRLDNRDELLRSLRDRWLHRDSSDSELVRAAYDESSDDFAVRLRGDFACAIFDVAANRLLIARDRLGVRPLCYTRVDDTFLFATEAKSLLRWPGVDPTPDDLMVADFLLQFVALDSQSRTFFRDIRSVPPAHVLVVTPDGSTLRRYFDFDTRRQIRLGSVPEYVDAFHHVMTIAVRRRLQHRGAVAVSVSGGLDSAYIFSIAARLVRDGSAACPAVLGFNYAGTVGSLSDEESFVRAVEESCQLAIDRIPQQSGFMEFAGQEVWHSESPLIEALACQRQAMFRRAREAGAHSLLTGHWGDQMLFDADYLLDLFRSGGWRTLARHARGWRIGARQLAMRVARDITVSHVPPSVVSVVRLMRRQSEGPWQAPWLTTSFRKLLRGRFEESRLPRMPGTSHAWAIYRQSRRGYHVQCMEWNSRLAAMHGIDIAFPYLDCDLVEFLMGIPGDVQSLDGVPRGLMRAAMRGIVADTVVTRKTKGEFTQLANHGIATEFPAIAEILGPSSLAIKSGYLNGPAIWPRLEQWRRAITSASDAVVANRVLELCGLELLLRQFSTTKDPAIVGESQLSTVS